MPYIPRSQKEKSLEGEIKDAGSFNFLIHQLMDKYIEQNGVSYQTYNDIVGAMDCAKMELYRRLVSPYEDKKILLNGDVEPYNNAD